MYQYSLLSCGRTSADIGRCRLVKALGAVSFSSEETTIVIEYKALENPFNFELERNFNFDALRVSRLLSTSSMSQPSHRAKFAPPVADSATTWADVLAIWPYIPKKDRKKIFGLFFEGRATSQLYDRTEWARVFFNLQCLPHLTSEVARDRIASALHGDNNADADADDDDDVDDILPTISQHDAPVGAALSGDAVSHSPALADHPRASAFASAAPADVVFDNFVFDPDTLATIAVMNARLAERVNQVDSSPTGLFTAIRARLEQFTAPNGPRVDLHRNVVVIPSAVLRHNPL